MHCILSGSIETHTVYDRLHIQAKTLFLGGADDGLKLSAQAAQTVEDIPNAQLIMIDDGGHAPFFEKPEEFYLPLMGFIASEPLPMPRSNR